MKKIQFNFLNKNWGYRALVLSSIGILLSSCSTQMGNYTETDGVYYDPSKDVIPENIVLQEVTNIRQNDQNNDSQSIIKHARNLEQSKNNKYHYWDSNNLTESDWDYINSNRFYYDSWGHPYYGSFGYHPYWGTGWGLGFGWGVGYGWNSYFSMNWGYPYHFSRWYSPFYNPYWGWSSAYWGGYYGYPYGGYVVAPRYYNYRRSGASNFRNPNGSAASQRQNTFRGGFRNGTSNVKSNNNRSYQRNTNTNTPSVPGRFRNAPRSNERYNTPQNNTYRTPSTWGNTPSGGFRSGNTSGAGRSSGGFRSGGFR